jgi:GTP-binding protein
MDFNLLPNEDNSRFVAILNKKIKTARFMKGVIGKDVIFEDGLPEIAFIGRSNTGKSSVINSLVGSRDLAKTSSYPGRTQQINLFLINNSFYFVDLPGYGYAKVPNEIKDKIREMINWYFFDSGYEQKITILIIDAKVGPTKGDVEALFALDDHKKNTIIVANKIDRLKSTDYEDRSKKIKQFAGDHKVIAYSAKKKIGVEELLSNLL